MDKAGEAFGDNYRFDAKIDAKPATGRAAAPAASTTEPATDDLVAEEHDGLPFPDNTANRAVTSS